MLFLLLRESYSYRSNGALHAGSAYEANTWPETSRGKWVRRKVFPRALLSFERKYTNFLSSILFSNVSFLFYLVSNQNFKVIRNIFWNNFLEATVSKNDSFSLLHSNIFELFSITNHAQFIKEIAHCQGCAVPPR